MDKIYERLAKLGYSRAFLSHVMPDWWTEEADQDPLCVLDGALSLSGSLGLDIMALLRPECGRLLRRDPWAQLPSNSGRNQLDM